jgi:hypothetical protein
MRLYHFTSSYNLKNVGPENIVAVGLKPHRIDWGGLCDDREGVWLTSDPDYATGGAMSAHAQVRITVVIPSTRIRPATRYPAATTLAVGEVDAQTLRPKPPQGSPTRLPRREASIAGQWYVYFGDDLTFVHEKSLLIESLQGTLLARSATDRRLVVMYSGRHLGLCQHTTPTLLR